MKIFDILNRYKIDGRKRPIRGGFGLRDDFLDKSMRFTDILKRKKRVFSNTAFQDSQKPGKFSASLSPTQGKQGECSQSVIQAEQGGCGQPSARIEQSSLQPSVETAQKERLQTHSQSMQRGCQQVSAQIKQGGLQPKVSAKQKECHQTRAQAGQEQYLQSGRKKFFQPRIHPEQGRETVVGLGQRTPLESNTQPEQSGCFQKRTQFAQGEYGQPSVQPEHGHRMVAGLGQLTPLESHTPPEQGGCFQKRTQFAQGEYGQLHTLAEQGRSMVEILGVLAVIGVLTVGGIMGYRYAMNKSRANDVLNYVRIGHTIISAMNGVPTKATPNDLEELKYPSTDLPYYYGDETAFYIGMPAIEKGVCQLIPDMIASPIIGVYTIEGETLTPDKCTENIELEYAFEWGDNQELECLLDCGDHGKPNATCLACDCMPRFAGEYCDECAGGWQTEEGNAIQCNECPEPFTQQGDVCGCTVQGCEISNTTTDCSCAKCSTEFNYELKQPVNDNGNECVPDEEGGACGWLCEAKEGNACSFNYINDEPYLIDVPPEFCSYTYENPKPEIIEVKPSDCSYTYENSTPTPNSSATIKFDKTCPTNEYCYPKWTDKSCGNNTLSTVPTSGEKIYGVCLSLNSIEIKCSLGYQISEATATFDKTCPTNEYCYPKWTDKSCGNNTLSTVPTSGEKIYGVCLSLNSIEIKCSLGYQISEALMWPETKCPAGQYCYSKWTQQNCSSNLPANGSDQIFGICINLNTSNTPYTCPKPN